MDELWDRLTTGTIGGLPVLSLVTGVLALLLVLQPGLWRIARNVVTIAHEGGHAVVALVCGRRLSGVRLHSDTSGLTVSAGKPTGPGMVFTLLAGYLAAPLLGIGGAALVVTDRTRLMLWLCIALLVLMLLAIRNAYGVLSVVVTGGVLFAISWFATAPLQAAFAELFAWFLLLGGVRPVTELASKRGRRRARESDADQLARLTGVPGAVWLALWFLIALAALALGGQWLLVGTGTLS